MSDRKCKSARSWWRGRHHLSGTPFDRLVALRVWASITGGKNRLSPLFQKHIDCCTNTTGRGESNVIRGWAAAGSEVMQSRRKEGLVRVFFFATILIFQYSWHPPSPNVIGYFAHWFWPFEKQDLVSFRLHATCLLLLEPQCFFSFFLFACSRC